MPNVTAAESPTLRNRAPVKEPPSLDDPGVTNTSASGTETTNTEPRIPSVLRSASYPHLPSATASDNPNPFLESTGTKRVSSKTFIARPVDAARQRSSLKQRKSELQITEKANGLGRQNSGHARENLGLRISRPTLALQPSPDYPEFPPKADLQGDKVRHDGKPRSLSYSLSSFARKSWITSSRSPSPDKRQAENLNASRRNSSETRSRSPSTSGNETQVLPARSISNARSQKSERKSTIVSRKAKRPISAFLGKSTPSSNVNNPAVPPIPKSFSTDTLPSFVHQKSTSERPPMLPITSSFERLQKAGLDSPRKKDELWGHFRTLDGEFHKFQSKPSTLKVNIIRSTLLPFLRTYSHHPSDKVLRAEDLDRRVNILNKWWTGLLEMLNGRNGQSMSGNDRPAVLEGVTEIMIRPEWRLSLTSITNQRSKSLHLDKTSTSSLESMASDFLAESVIHNVRNMFVENLLAQMAFVVDKMSMRNVAASVVAFCGKAAAYAFFFCPGIAEILVRLWSVTSESVRRVLNEVDILRTTNLRSTADSVAATFPPHLHPLAFRSLASMMRYLRGPPASHRSSTSISWHGPWVGRWSGRDSDLFFIFTKHFHMLACQFLSEDVSKRERACAPCYVLVQAQMLMVLDDTIHRPVGRPLAEPIDGPSSITFDDMLEADTNATALPLSPTTAIRSMAQNRLIMLLREFLSETTNAMQNAQKTFAESFTDLLKATARRTSLFDHDACFALCDFMEESITILTRYEQNIENTAPFLDWPFWIETCRKMMKSDNSMTEVRLYAFIYSLWGILTSDATRKRDICLDWLLEDEHFDRQFNHWCPMVRAYFMRLLCWRVARFDGEMSELDFIILETLSIRLKTVWSHFLYMSGSAARNPLRSPSPSTAPCAPAPGRRFLIIRNDVQSAPGGAFLSFDGIVPASSATQATAYQSHSSLDSLSQMALQEDPHLSLSPAKKRWGLLKYVIPFSIATTERSKSSTSSTDSRAIDRSATASEKGRNRDEGAMKENSPPTGSDQARNDLKQPHRQHRNQSFKFSLEWIDKHAGVPKERRLYPPRLPLPAQMFLQSKRAEPHEFHTRQPIGAAIGPSKYAGRALAEWSLIVAECQNFFERRKFEGIPGNRWVETPTLGVESIRRPG